MVKKARGTEPKKNGYRPELRDGKKKKLLRENPTTNRLPLKGEIRMREGKHETVYGQKGWAERKASKKNIHRITRRGGGRYRGVKN